MRSRAAVAGFLLTTAALLAGCGGEADGDDGPRGATFPRTSTAGADANRTVHLLWLTGSVQHEGPAPDEAPACTPAYPDGWLDEEGRTLLSWSAPPTGFPVAFLDASVHLDPYHAGPGCVDPPPLTPLRDGNATVQGRHGSFAFSLHVLMQDGLVVVDGMAMAEGERRPYDINRTWVDDRGRAHNETGQLTLELLPGWTVRHGDAPPTGLRPLRWMEPA